MATELDKYLEHHGIKGMRWGVRRTDAQLGNASDASQKPSKAGLLRRKKAEKANSPITNAEGEGQTIRSLNKQKAGSLVTLRQEDGTVRTLVKKKDGTWAETHMAVDAERFAKTRQKEGHELSDREMKEAIQRARSIKEYNEMFSENPNSALKDKVDALRLQKDYRDLQSQMAPPSASDRLASLMKNAEAAYEGYKKADAIYKDLNGRFGGKKASTPSSAAADTKPKSKPKQQPRATPIFNISDVGKPTTNYPNPAVLQLPRGR